MSDRMLSRDELLAAVENATPLEPKPEEPVKPKRKRRPAYGWAASMLEGLPDAVVSVREDRRLSIRRAAAEIGIPKSTLERFEKADGETTVHTVVPILRWLGRNR